jgi:hypothetical protein
MSRADATVLGCCLARGWSLSRMLRAAQPFRQLGRLVAIALSVVLVWLVMEWWYFSGDFATEITPRPSVSREVTVLRTSQTPREIAHLFDGRVRIAWLRAEDWCERRGPLRQPQADSSRFIFTPDPAGQPSEIEEPGAFFDGGGKDAEVPGVGRWFDRQGTFAVWGLDSHEGRERELVPVGRLFNPLLTPDGRRIIYTREIVAADDTTRFETHEVDWDTGTGQMLTHGYALAVHDDRQSGERWLFGTDRFDAVWREPLGQPDRRQVVYRGPFSRRFSLAGDGLSACGEFPWPQVGVLDLTTGVVDRRGLRDGCNSSIAPDGSGFVSILNGAHDGVTIFDAERRGTEIDLLPPAMKRTSTGLRGKVWNPRWAADSRHLILSGPIRPRQADAADIWIGAFTPDRRAIRTWVQVTDSDAFDISPSLWRETDVFLEQHHVLPAIATTQVVGESQVLLRFTRPVRADALRVASDLPSSAHSERFHNDHTVLTTFDRPVPDSAVLHVQVPAAEGTEVALQATVKNLRWPSDRSGLLARWLGQPELSSVLVGSTLVTLHPSVAGAARRDRDGSLLLLGGSYRLETERVPTDGAFVVDGPGIRIDLAFALHHSSASTPTRLADVSACLESGGTLVVEELGGELRVVIGKQRVQRILLGTIRDRDLHSISLACQEGTFIAWLDGIEVARSTEVEAVRLSGTSLTVEGHGHARLHGIALSQQASATLHQRADHRTQQTRISPTPSHRVRVRAVRRSVPPTLADIHPYRSALAVNAYDVVRGAGTLANGTTILVAQWIYLDGEVMDQHGRVGEELDLRVELFADHPELGSAYLIDTLGTRAPTPLYVETDR